jgi:hypothetical protein
MEPWFLDIIASVSDDFKWVLCGIAMQALVIAANNSLEQELA